jgi:hypothetical protein
MALCSGRIRPGNWGCDGLRRRGSLRRVHRGLSPGISGPSPRELIDTGEQESNSIERSQYRLSLRVITLMLASCLTSFAQSTPASAVAQKLAGSWVENESKTKIGESFAKLRFQKSADGGLEEVRGSEASPLVQPVKFGAKAYAFDGSVNTIEWKQIDSRHFERKIFHEGKLQNIRRIEISKDGKTLTQVTESSPDGGKKSTGTITYERISGGPEGLAGIWKPRSVKTNPPPEIRFESIGTDRLKFSNRNGVTYTYRLDNTPVVSQGPTVIAGSMVAARTIDDHTLEETNSRQGVVTGKAVYSVSADGKILTITFSQVGGGTEPSVQVFEKR